MTTTALDWKPVPPERRTRARMLDGSMREYSDLRKGDIFEAIDASGNKIDPLTYEPESDPGMRAICTDDAVKNPIRHVGYGVNVKVGSFPEIAMIAQSLVEPTTVKADDIHGGVSVGGLDAGLLNRGRENQMKHGRPDYDGRIQDSAGIIPDDEPVFLLRGTDAMAARTVRYYADQLEGAGATDEHVAAIRSHALDIQNWRPKKSPDRPDMEGGLLPKHNPA